MTQETTKPIQIAEVQAGPSSGTVPTRTDSIPLSEAFGAISNVSALAQSTHVRKGSTVQIESLRSVSRDTQPETKVENSSGR